MKFAIHKFYIGLLMYICGGAFGITFDQLTLPQKQIHTFLYKIVQGETQKFENHFAVALEIITEDKKSRMFLLKFDYNFSFESKPFSAKQQGSFVPSLCATHKKICGDICMAEDTKLCIMCPTCMSSGEEKCLDLQCYFYRKSLLDSEFICINFLENSGQSIIDWLNAYQKSNKIGQIIEINFHGFSARDTCLACFCHLGLYCEKANQAFNSEGIGEDANFWQKLKSVLFPDVSNPKIPVRFYISSKIKYDTTEFFEKDRDKCEMNAEKLTSVNETLMRLKGIQERLTQKVEEISVRFMNMLVIRETLSEDCKSDGSASFRSRFKSQLGSDENLCEGFKGCLDHIPTIKETIDGLRTLETPVVELPIFLGITDGATPSTVSLTAGIPPSTPEEQETIPAGYHLQDVSRDGNCGVWALLQAIHPEIDFLSKTPEQQTMMMNLRRDVGMIVPATDIDARIRISIPALSVGDASHWIDTEDFKYFAQHLRQPIAIIVRNLSGEITYRHYSGTGDVTNPASIPDGRAFGDLIAMNPNTLILYYSHNHYQAIVKDTQPGEGSK